MTKKIIASAIIALSVIFAARVYASDFGVEDGLNMLDISGLESAVRESGGEGMEWADVRELFRRAVTGELELSAPAIMKAALDALKGGIGEFGGLMRNMLIIAVISAVFKALTENFKAKSVGEIGFFAYYVIVAGSLSSSIYVCVNIMNGLTDRLLTLMDASIPVMTAIMGLSGKMTAAYAMTPVMLFALDLLSRLQKFVIVPVIIFGASVQLLNLLSEQDSLERLAELVKSAAGRLIKIIALLFAAIMGLQGISAPIMNNLAVKSAKSVVNLVPVIGQTLSGAVDTVLYLTSSMKSGALVVIVILIVMYCAVPVMKLLICAVVFKATAALIQPIADKRLVKAVDGLGGYAGLILSVTVTIAATFIIMTVIALAF